MTFHREEIPEHDSTTTTTTMQKTLALIKPDAVKAGKAREILRRIERDGFTILRKKELQLSSTVAGDFYVEHKGRAYYRKLITFMCTGPIVAMILSRQDAIQKWRELMGPTNSVIAREQVPSSIRGQFGTDGTLNAVHGSDSVQSALREIQFFFPGTPCLQGTEAEGHIESSREEVGPKLDSLLTDGLTALAKEKPTNNVYEAVRFLGKWLISNNPNKPKTTFSTSSDNEGEAAAFPCEAIEVGDRAEEQEAKQISTEEAAIKVQAAYRGHQIRRQAIA